MATGDAKNCSADSLGFLGLQVQAHLYMPQLLGNLMTKAIFSALFLIPLLSGCAHMNSRAIAYGDTAEDKLFVWGSQYSAGIGTNGGMCAQAATTARATSVGTDVAVGDKALGLINPATLTSEDNGKLAEVAVSTNQSVMLTNATNAQTAFANIAFFYLCQISLNQKLQPNEIVEMWKATTGAISSVGTATVNTPTIAPSTPIVRDREPEQ